MADEMNKREFLKYLGLAGITSAAAIATAKKAVADTIITDEGILLDNKKFTISHSAVVGDGGAVDYDINDYANASAAIQAAIDNNDTVMILGATYSITATINVNRAGITILGEQEATILQPASGVTVFNITASQVTIDSLTIESDRVNPCTGIYAGQVISHVNLRNLVIDSLKGTGIHADILFDSVWSNIKIRNCGDSSNACILYDSDVSDGTNHIFWFGGVISKIQGTGIELNGNDDLETNTRLNLFNAVYIHGDTPTPIVDVDAIQIKGNSYSNTFRDGAIQGNGGYGLNIIKGFKNGLLNNTVAANTKSDVIISSGEGNLIEQCSFPASPATVSIDTQNGSFTRIVNNYWGAVAFGIYTGWRSQVKNNVFKAITTTAIKVYGTAADISGNIIYASPSGAIDVNNINDINITNNNVASLGINNIGTGCFVVNNQRYNPIGALTPPAMPASGVAYTNSFGSPCLVTISGGTVSDIRIDGGATGLTSGSFILQSLENIRVYYTVAPTWYWFGM